METQDDVTQDSCAYARYCIENQSTLLEECKANADEDALVIELAAKIQITTGNGVGVADLESQLAAAKAELDEWQSGRWTNAKTIARAKAEGIEAAIEIAKTHLWTTGSARKHNGTISEVIVDLESAAKGGE